jgi:hypothetical protein
MRKRREVMPALARREEIEKMTRLSRKHAADQLEAIQVRIPEGRRPEQVDVGAASLSFGFRQKSQSSCPSPARVGRAADCHRAYIRA